MSDKLSRRMLEIWTMWPFREIKWTSQGHWPSNKCVTPPSAHSTLCGFSSGCLGSAVGVRDLDIDDPEVPWPGRENPVLPSCALRSQHHEPSLETILRTKDPVCDLKSLFKKFPGNSGSETRLGQILPSVLFTWDSWETGSGIQRLGLWLRLRNQFPSV